MKTKPKTFDAVIASRQWREQTSKTLDAMPMVERIAFLEGLRTVQTERKPNAAGDAAGVRENTAAYGPPGTEVVP